MSPEVAQRLNWYLLPEKIREIKKYCGWEVALALIEHCEGIVVRVPMPKNLPVSDPDNSLSRIAPHLVEKLSKSYPGLYISVPRAYHALLALRNADIIAQRKAGKSVVILAREHGLTERHVWNIVGNIHKITTNKQQSLFVDNDRENMLTERMMEAHNAQAKRHGQEEL